MNTQEIMSAIKAMNWWSIMEEELTQEQITYIIDMYNDKENISYANIKYFINQFTLEQLLTINGSIAPEDILLTKDGTLSDYQDYLDEHKISTNTYSLLFTKFFTEEDIIAYPTLFTPSTFRKSAVLFLTKDTMKLLNKTHGNRFRLNSNSGKLKSIVSNRNFNKMPLKPKDFLYLIEKTNATNRDILEVIAYNNRNLNINKKYKQIKELLSTKI